jgi:2'-phosphotransferase
MDNKHKISASKRLGLITRHKLDIYPHDKEGFVNIQDIFNSDFFPYQLTINEVKYIVKTDNKDRFSLKELNGNTYIRSNQGHSSGTLDQELLLTPINIPIEGCFHGTYTKNLDLIKKNGLSKMKRHHIHFAESEISKSGKRFDTNVKIYINMGLAMIEGIKFYRSANNVILTPGDSKGFLKPKYFSNIVVK